jgi:hypothetical protein
MTNTPKERAEPTTSPARLGHGEVKRRSLARSTWADRVSFQHQQHYSQDFTRLWQRAHARFKDVPWDRKELVQVRYKEMD